MTTFDGSALVVVRWNDKGAKEPAVLRVWTEDGCEVMVEVDR